MTKYVAKVDYPGSFKQGEIVEANSPLLPVFADKLDKYDGPLEVGANVNDDDAGKIIAGTALNDGAEHEPIGNLSREELKAKADQLEIDYAQNISTAKLVELVQAKIDADKEAAEEEAKEEDE